MKVVLDTNIWISGILIPKSIAGKVINFWEAGKLNIIVSEPIINEIARVLQYPKIQKVLKWPDEKIQNYVEYIQFFAESVSFTNTSVEIKQDSDDNAILQTLITSNADYLITGDSDFNDYQQSYPIIKLIDFYNEFMIEL